MSASSDATTDSIDSISTFTDWSNRPIDEYQHTNEEIVEYLGNPISKPDTNNGSCIRPEIDGHRPDVDYLSCWRMKQYNTGYSNRKWTNTSYITYLVNKNMLEALMSQLDLTKEQKSRVYPFVMSLDFDDLGVGAELSTFCAIATLVHSDDTSREYHPNLKEVDQDEHFVRVKNSLRVSNKQVNSIISKLDPNNPQSDPERSNDYLKHEKRD